MKACSNHSNNVFEVDNWIVISIQLNKKYLIYLLSPFLYALAPLCTDIVKAGKMANFNTEKRENLTHDFSISVIKL